jgi:hypothetical protein
MLAGWFDLNKSKTLIYQIIFVSTLQQFAVVYYKYRHTSDLSHDRQKH